MCTEALMYLQREPIDMILLSITFLFIFLYRYQKE
jgi:hypothetical protein